MLFNSHVFLLAFLPTAFALYFAAARREAVRLPVLLALSLAFYAYWDVRFLPVLAGSVLGNWLLAELHRRTRAGVLPTLAIVANLAVLGLYKYLDFLAGLVGAALGVRFPAQSWALPLGISFFTFHHVMYWADLARGRAPYFRLIEYALYISFFPQVLSGPLVRWWELMDQLRRPPFGPGWQDRFALGIVFVTVGLVQKVFCGDPLAGIVDPLYAAAALRPLGFIEGWAAALSFTFQVFFDFAAYSEIAIGLGLMFGVTLPPNFARPLNASSLATLWQRWHMTLARFLRDYV